MAWATVDQARAHWPDSASLPDDTLTTLLEVATTQCSMYAPSALLHGVVEATLVLGSTDAVAIGGYVFIPIDVGAEVAGEGVDEGPPGPKCTIETVSPEGTSATLSNPATASIDTLLTLSRRLPHMWMLGTVYQAREVYAAGQRDGDIIGIGDYAIRARPLTSTVKSLLRPQMQPPRVG